ncbi:MAG: hypothetical protein IKH13_02985 [Clostridia bacterium]|nr:hypothetical protein [Clostridia bacterium]
MYNNKKLVLSIFWILAGAALITLAVTEILDSSVYAGMGGALIAVGFFQAVRNIKYRKNADYREKVDIEANDERYIYLRMKSWMWTGYLFVILAAVASIIAMILGEKTVQLTLGFSVGTLLVIYFVSFFALSRKN